jgi:hypothetical protein
MAVETDNGFLESVDSRPADAAILRRIDELSEWLTEHAPYCQTEHAHLNEGSRERAYWHYGYLMALRDCAERHQLMEQKNLH